METSGAGTLWPLWIRPREDEIARFRNIPDGGKIVFFTPQLEHQRLDDTVWPRLPDGGIDNIMSVNQLGLLMAISEHTIIQKPYSVGSRFTDVHEAVIEEAAGVIVLVAQCRGDDDPREVKIDMTCQIDFCWSTKDVINDDEVFAESSRPPLILIFVGDLETPVWPQTELKYLDNIITCPTLDNGNTAKIVAEIYGNPALAQ
jgi:hypothetical protein